MDFRARNSQGVCLRPFFDEHPLISARDCAPLLTGRRMAVACLSLVPFKTASVAASRRALDAEVTAGLLFRNAEDALKMRHY